MDGTTFSTREKDGDAAAFATPAPALTFEVRLRNMTLVSDRPIQSLVAERYLSDHLGIYISFDLSFCCRTTAARGSYAKTITP